MKMCPFLLQLIRKICNSSVIDCRVELSITPLHHQIVQLQTIMKKLSVALLLVYLLVLVLFALHSSVSEFKDMIMELRHNPADVYSAYFTPISVH